MREFDLAARDLPSRVAAHPGALSVPKLAMLLGFSRSAVYEMAQTGRIPHIRIGSSIRFDPAVTAQWLRERTVARQD